MTIGVGVILITDVLFPGFLSVPLSEVPMNTRPVLEVLFAPVRFLANHCRPIDRFYRWQIQVASDD